MRRSRRTISRSARSAAAGSSSVESSSLRSRTASACSATAASQPVDLLLGGLELVGGSGHRHGDLRVLGLEREHRALELGDRLRDEVVLLLGAACSQAALRRLASTLEPVDDRGQRFALGDEPPGLGRGEPRPRRVERPARGLAPLLDVRALGLGPGEHELRFLGRDPRGLSGGANLPGVRSRSRAAARLEPGVPLDDRGQLTLGLRLRLGAPRSPRLGG